MPNKIFFTADLHLGHENILKYCNRPFRNAQEMDGVILDNLNSQVHADDRLYVVGDFTFGGVDRVRSYRDRIHCKNVYLIPGNHDYLSVKQYEEMFVWASPLREIKVGSTHIVLCHYAMRRWPRSHKGSWHLYGHSHGQLPDDGKTFSFDVGVDCHNYFPLSFEDVADNMASRRLAIAEPNHPKVEPGHHEETWEETHSYVSCTVCGECTTCNLRPCRDGGKHRGLADRFSETE